MDCLVLDPDNFFAIFKGFICVNSFSSCGYDCCLEFVVLIMYLLLSFFSFFFLFFINVLIMYHTYVNWLNFYKFFITC